MLKVKNINSLQVVDRQDGEEFYLKVSPGDIFISWHTSMESSVATFIKKRDLNTENLKRVFSDAQKKIKIESNTTEVKLIGDKKSIDLANAFFKSQRFSNCKLVEKDGVSEVFYIAHQSKVRVSKFVEESNQNMSNNVVRSVNTLKNSTEVVQRKYKVLIVDDSKTIRNILTKIFSNDPDLEVCATAEKPSDVEALIQKHKPDVITLDIHMPEMDGVTLLKKIAPLYHIPTVMITSISIAEGPLVLEALENGAVDYIQKPEVSYLDRLTPMIVEKVKTAAKAKVQKKSSEKKSQVPVRLHNDFNLDSLILMGSSTGGTEALRDILTRLPKDVPPILIVQHIPAVFSLAFAKRMNELCPFEVKEAEDGDEVKKNRVLIAPGGMQMKLEHKSNKTVVRLTDDEPVNRFKPSVDYLFMSAVNQLYTHTIAVILTGMGKDGAKGMYELRQKGVRTIAQNEETCVVFGMPKEAINIGGAEYVEGLHDIAERMVALSHDGREKNLRKSS